MAKVILSLNGNFQGEYELAKERMTIGRKPENDIAINNLAVSGQHALLLTVLDDVFIEDLGSTNGTYVNGKLIKKQALKHGDIIGIGKHELKYINENASAEADDFEKTVFIGSVSPQAAAMANNFGQPGPTGETAKKEQVQSMTVSQPRTSSPGMPKGKLHVLNGPIAGKELILTKALTTLGKPGVQVAVIAKRPQGYFLTHIEGNKDGKPIFPEVNGESIGAKAHALSEHDIIELAGIKMEFSYEN